MIPLTNHDFQGSVAMWGRDEIYPDPVAPEWTRKMWPCSVGSKLRSTNFPAGQFFFFGEGMIFWGSGCAKHRHGIVWPLEYPLILYIYIILMVYPHSPLPITLWHGDFWAIPQKYTASMDLFKGKSTPETIVIFPWRSWGFPVKIVP